MGKTDLSQLELFSQITGHKQKQIGGPHSFFHHILGHEKAVLLVILFIVTSIVSFSFGVEKGKKMTQVKTNYHLDMARQGITRQYPYQQPAVEKFVEDKEETATPAYTIQVATFRTRTYAEKEAQGLKKQGFTTVVLSKGNFSIVCVGNFTNQKQAQILLSKLKKQYQGCYVRRL